MAFVVSPGEHNERRWLAPLMDALCAHGYALAGSRLVADKGYTGGRVNAWCAQHEVQPVIPRFRTQAVDATFDRRCYRDRNAIERLINRLKQYRRIATRYEKRGDMYLAMLTLVAVMCWL